MNNRLNSLIELHRENPNDSFVSYGIALEYISAKDYKSAETYLKELLKNDEKYVPAYMQFAMMKEKLGEIDEAKNLYLEGIKIAKETGDNHAAKEMEEFLNDLE
jgi:Tfp pilus assembly protein PilF